MPEPESGAEEQSKELPLVVDHSDHPIVHQPQIAPAMHQPHWFISRRTVVALLFMLCCALYYHEFWLDVVKTFLDSLAAFRNATIYSTVGILALKFIYSFCKSQLPMNQIMKRLLDALVTFLKSDVVWFLVASGFIVIVFVSAPQVYTERKAELAKLTPNGASRPYEALFDDVKSIKASEEKERTARIKAEEKRDFYREQGINWLIAITNNATAIPVLDNVIADIRRERAATMTNDNPKLAILLRQEIELNKLQETRSIVVTKSIYADYSAILAYIGSAYQDKFSALVSKCGSTIRPPPPLPAPEWWLTTDDLRIKSVSTNCGARFEYAFWRRNPDAATEILIESNKAKRAYIDFIITREPPILHSRLYIGDDFHEWRDSGLQDKAKCIKDADFLLDLLLESQTEVFR
jgi:hypothetical protein